MLWKNFLCMDPKKIEDQRLEVGHRFWQNQQRESIIFIFDQNLCIITVRQESCSRYLFKKRPVFPMFFPLFASIDLIHSNVKFWFLRNFPLLIYKYLYLIWKNQMVPMMSKTLFSLWTIFVDWVFLRHNKLLFMSKAANTEIESANMSKLSR